MSAPLEGLRGVVLTETPTAAYAAALLARLGAEVAHVALDPGADEGVDLLRSLLPAAHFVLEDCAARVLADGGMDVDTARAAHPTVVWCAVAPAEAIAGGDAGEADVIAAWHAVAAVLLGVRVRASGVGADEPAPRLDLDLRTVEALAVGTALPTALPLRFAREPGP